MTQSSDVRIQAIRTSKSRGWLHVLSLTAACCTAALTTSSASASQVFPGAIQEAADMPCPPPCTLCHTVTPGTAATWTKPFGVAIKANGAIAGDADSAKAAFARFAANPAPANAAVVQSLKEGRYPADDPQLSSQELCGASYGCGASIARQPAASQSNGHGVPLAAAFATLVGLIASRRVRSRRTTRAE